MEVVMINYLGLRLLKVCHALGWRVWEALRCLHHTGLWWGENTQKGLKFNDKKIVSDEPACNLSDAPNERRMSKTVRRPSIFLVSSLLLRSLLEVCWSNWEIVVDEIYDSMLSGVEVKRNNRQGLESVSQPLTVRLSIGYKSLYFSDHLVPQVLLYPWP